MSGNLLSILSILCVILLSSSGCSRSEQDHRDIHKILAVRAEALNSQNMPLYLSAVSQHYNDKGKDFIKLKESLEKSFTDSDVVSYEADQQNITVDGNSAEATGSYRMKVKVRDKEMNISGTEHLRLAKEPKGWKISAGL